MAARGFGLGVCGIVIAGMGSACGPVPRPSPTGAVQAATSGPMEVSVWIPHADRFTPAIVVIPRGGRVTFRNGDGDAHNVTSIATDPSAFNLALAAGATETLTLNESGVYRYYCNVHAEYDAVTDQIAGLPHADHPNEPMSGAIIVQ